MKKQLFDDNNFENYKKEYNLSVGQFAKLCGTTRDTLRHYYETGILIPRTDENNGYHYYSPSQVSSFYFITTFRQAGCSLKEIEEIIHSTDKTDIRSIATSKLVEMQRELFVLHNKIASLNLGLWLLEKHEDNKNKGPQIEVLNNISVAVTKIEAKKNAHHTKDIAKELMKHINTARTEQNISVFPTGATISYDDLCMKNYVYNNIISLSIHPADGINTFELPSNTVVSCYHNHANDDIRLTYKKIIDFINSNNLKVCSDLHIISLINLYDNQNRHTYFKYLFICVNK